MLDYEEDCATCIDRLYCDSLQREQRDLAIETAISDHESLGIEVMFNGGSAYDVLSASAAIIDAVFDHDEYSYVNHPCGCEDSEREGFAKFVRNMAITMVMDDISSLSREVAWSVNTADEMANVVAAAIDRCFEFTDKAYVESAGVEAMMDVFLSRYGM